MKKVLIIGANSYIGQGLLRYVSSYQKEFTRAMEHLPDQSQVNTRDDARNQEEIILTMISASTGEWKTKEFTGYDAVLLLSGIVHKKETSNMAEHYDKINHRMAVAIAKKAKESQVKQFIFMSTMAVYGDKAECITQQTIPKPSTYYGKSKLAAEEDIIKLQEDIKVAIVRPPMVYGEGCKGNYPRLVKLAKLIPVFPKLHNKRSMIHINTLCEFLTMLIKEGTCGYYLPQDDEYVDTCELVVRLRKEMGKKTWLIGIFNGPVRLLAKYVGSVRKMFGDCYYEKTLK